MSIIILIFRCATFLLFLDIWIYLKDDDDNDDEEDDDDVDEGEDESSGSYLKNNCLPWLPKILGSEALYGSCAFLAFFLLHLNHFWSSLFPAHAELQLGYL